MAAIAWQRLSTFQYPDGLFAIWCGGQPGVDITSRVAHRLLGLRGLPFPMSDTMLVKAKDALLAAKHRDNSLLRKAVQREGSQAYWKALSSWGGNLEVSADAARVMYAANDELFRPAFAFVTSKLVNGMGIQAIAIAPNV